MKKRFYIIFVAREADGRLRKVPVPLHYAYIFVAAALVGAFTIAGMAGSYSRMLLKTASFDQVRSQREALRKDYAKLEVQAHQKDVQAASLGSLATQISALYGFHGRTSKAVSTAAVPVLANSSPDSSAGFSQQAYARSLDQFAELRTAALVGHMEPQFTYQPHPFATNADTVLGGSATPSLWPVTGRLTSSFGERSDPFNGEGAFHAGLDIATSYGTPIHAPADGVIAKAGPAGGYGREMIIDHGGGVTTVYGHLSAFAMIAGQLVRQGQIVGYVGSAGRSTGPHLHYEVRVNNMPVNPHKYLRETMDQQETRMALAASGAAGSSRGAP
ncbi:M23 family metallopeptidase [Acidipila sp. EB88]|uniref:M23 family metallopeptidase n=1 Tax=Acidipila sp. EB88 TaxID=2305226 RepID=UPI000F5E0B34|nr:M23 family metallopeptidase [Acidipila sp. EB88]RRA48551.1 M23 family peptidase [Acidipila sp. EB88]